MVNFTERQFPTLLLIDDDMVSREVTATVLTMNGYTVHTAVDGAASVELLEAGECAPEVILMDAQMPGLSGARLIEELRARSRASVYAISGSGAPDEVVAAADGFLLKPFGADELRRLLEEREKPAGEPAPTVDRSSSLGWEFVQACGDPVVSAATLAQLRGLMSDAAVREIYAAIVADLALRLDALEGAVAMGDAAEVRRIGHAIKGGCAMAGAMQAARLGALLESGIAVSGGDHLDNSAGLLRDLRAAARNLKRMLEAEFPA
jgi:CheY-like chemotaxis protein